MRTWREIHASFDRLRERYHLDAEDPLMVPLTAAALRWAWTRDPRVWAKTHFDEGPSLRVRRQRTAHFDDQERTAMGVADVNQIGVPVNSTSKGETVLEEAARLTSSDRPSQYGPPSEHFARTVAILNVLWAAKLSAPLTAEDWPLAMMADKLARFVHVRQRDSMVDVCGYARTWEMVKAASPERAPVWRHIESSGPFGPEPAQDYTVEECAPGDFVYRYRACECAPKRENE